MAAIVGTSGFTGGYVGSTPVQALYLGQDLVWWNNPNYSSVSRIYYNYQGGGTPFDASVQIPVNPAYPGYKVRIVGTLLSSDQYPTGYNRGVFSNTDAGHQTYFRIGDPKSTHSALRGPQWFGGEHEFGIPTTGSSVVGQTIDWNLERNGIYDNIAGQWVQTGLSNDQVDANPITCYFRYFKYGILQIWGDGGLVFDGFAASRNSDGQGGLYDRVSKTFYTDENAIITCE